MRLKPGNRIFSYNRKKECPVKTLIVYYSRNRINCDFRLTYNRLGHYTIEPLFGRVINPYWLPRLHIAAVLTLQAHARLGFL